MIEAILAQGKQGQMGLKGSLPWHDPEDLKWFKQMTMGKVCICGYNTYLTLPPLPGRQVLLDPTSMHPLQIADLYDDLVIIGGPKTFARWAPYIQRWHIGVVNYHGPADCFFNPEWLESE